MTDEENGLLCSTDQFGSLGDEVRAGGLPDEAVGLGREDRRNVEFFLDDSLLSRTPREPFTVSYPLSGVTPGEHRLRAVATDLSGQVGEDEVIITVE